MKNSMYFSSAKLRATYFYFLLNQDTTLDPKLKQHTKVLLLFIVLPDQSASV